MRLEAANLLLARELELERAAAEQLRADGAHATDLASSAAAERKVLLKQLSEAGKSTKREEKAVREELGALKEKYAASDAERRELEEAAKGRVKALRALQDDVAKQAKALAAERVEKQQLEARLAHGKGEIGALESRLGRANRDVRGKEAALRELRARFDGARAAEGKEADERSRLDERCKALGGELARKERTIGELKAKVEQREAALLTEQSAVEQRAAVVAAEPLKRSIAARDAQLRSNRVKLDASAAELAAAREEADALRAELGKREARSKRQIESSAASLTAQLTRCRADEAELKLLLHRLAHALEHGVGRPGEDLQVTQLARSFLQLTPEELGIVDPSAPMADGEAPPVEPSHQQGLLQSALAEPLDCRAVFTVFTRLLQQRAEVDAATQRGANELVRLDGALCDYDALLKQIKSQVITEKAEAEVAIAQRDGTIQQLKARLASERLKAADWRD